ncbi:MAG TPA: HAD family hydrolase [Actinomycetota bacterium]|jgi:putative hydrolase of the HAD superfamily|nr:HAD family hydrolase [Actinomycetota bacterium]
MPEAHATLEMVFLDIGGVMYDDGVYARSWQRALREKGAEFTDAEFDDEYRAVRAAQAGSFRKHLSARFLPAVELAEVESLAATYWAYPPGALFPDVRPCLEALAGRYRLGVIANQPSRVRDAMVRDGVDAFIEVWGVSEDVGLEKPDPRLFSYAAREAGVAPSRAAMVGDRLDYDVRPARAAGMRTVWVLRGEAPDEPTADQLAEADAAVGGLAALPSVLEAW